MCVCSCTNTYVSLFRLPTMCAHSYVCSKFCTTDMHTCVCSSHQIFYFLQSRRRSGTHSEGGRESPNLPRYHELVSKMEEKKGVPGPGKYQIKSQFSPSAHHYHHHHHHHDHHQQQPSAQMEMYDVQTVPFGTAAKRFPAEKWTAPSPGSYDDPRTAFDSSKRFVPLALFVVTMNGKIV